MRRNIVENEQKVIFSKKVELPWGCQQGRIQDFLGTKKFIIRNKKSGQHFF